MIIVFIVKKRRIRRMNEILFFHSLSKREREKNTYIDQIETTNDLPQMQSCGGQINEMFHIVMPLKRLIEDGMETVGRRHADVFVFVTRTDLTHQTRW